METLKKSNRTLIVKESSIKNVKPRNECEGYAYNISSVMDRVHTYDERDRISSKWTVGTEDAEMPEDSFGMNGNLCSDFCLDPDDNLYKFLPYSEREYRKHLNFYDLMPPHLFLYRLMATFLHGPTWSGDGYKRIWGFELTHKETCLPFEIAEHKGSPTFWTPFMDISQAKKDVPESYLTDMLGLIDYLVSDRCVHPYDGTIAGTQA